MSTYQQPSYMLGLDLGQKRDYTALAVLRQSAVPRADAIEHRYDLVHLDRWRGRSYHEVVPIIRTVMDRLRIAGHEEYFERTGIAQAITVDQTLLVDHTGVGVAVVDELRAAGLDCIGITIHGGDATNRAGQDYRVPKRELVAHLQVVLETQRLGISDQLPLADVLLAELDNFRAKVKLSTGNDSYGAGAEWREANHDDLVLAVAMATWYGEIRARNILREPTGALADYLNRF